MVKQPTYRRWSAWGLIVLALAAMVAGGCAGKITPPPSQGIPMPEKTRDLVSRVSNFYPDNFNTIHRVVLSIRGREMVLKGYLKVNRSAGTVDLIAQGEMGGTLFEIHLEKGKPAVINPSDFFKSQWLENSVALDLNHLYLIPDLDRPKAFKTEKAFILSQSDHEATKSYIFSLRKDPEPELSRFRIRKEGKTVYQIRYTYSGNNPLPGFIRIENHNLDYTLDINARYM